MKTHKMLGARATDVSAPPLCHGMLPSRRHPRHSPIRRKVSCAATGEHQNQALWQQRRQLEALLRLSDPPHTAGDEAAHGSEDAAANLATHATISGTHKDDICDVEEGRAPDSSQEEIAGAIRNLPLWRVQTTVLPGAQVEAPPCQRRYHSIICSTQSLSPVVRGAGGPACPCPPLHAHVRADNIRAQAVAVRPHPPPRRLRQPGCAPLRCC